MHLDHVQQHRGMVRSCHWQQTGAAALQGVGQAGILPRAASCRAQAALPQVCQHLRSASPPLKPKQLFVERVLME